MNFTIPQPEQINIPQPSFEQIILPNVPTYLDRAYFDLDTHIQVPNLELDNILTTFYTIVTKSLILERLDDVLEIVNEVLTKLTAEYDYEIGKLSREYSKNLEGVMDTFGMVHKGLVSGLMVKSVNRLHTSELLDRQELSLKYKRKVTSELIDKFSAIVKGVDKVNDLYRDIFEKDFVVTAKAFDELLDYLVTAYNVYVSEVKSRLEQEAINLQLFEEKLRILVRSYEEIKEKYVFYELMQEEREAINQFLAQQQEYLAELERYKYLGYEVLQLQNQVYSAELRKFATEVEKVNKLASYIRERVELYLTRLGVLEAKQKLKGAELDLVNSEIGLRKAKLDIAESQIESLFSLYKAQYMLEENILEQEKLQKVDNFKLQIETEFKGKLSSLYNILATYTQNLDITLQYIQQQAYMRDWLLSTKSNVINQIDNSTSFVRERIAGAERFIGISYNALADWYRTCAVTHADITAKFLRQYT